MINYHCRHLHHNKSMDALLLSDIHGNYPALQAVDHFFADTRFDIIINCGDTTVYGPFPNETIKWLQRKRAYSITGNTDRKVVKLIKGKTFKKPKKAEKRIMYTWTHDVLDDTAQVFLLSLKKHLTLDLDQIDAGVNHTLHLFHGSPKDPDEFLFADTPDQRFQQLAKPFKQSIIVVGHSHSPFDKTVGPTRFINPGSVGRMFDGNPAASCATMTLRDGRLAVSHYRISYPIEQVVEGIRANRLPDIYATMYQVGRKLN